MAKIKDNSIEELTDLLIKEILEETYLSKETLTPKVTSFIKSFVHLKNKPSLSVSPTNERTKRWMDSIMHKDTEHKFWKSIVKERFPDELDKFNAEIDKIIFEKQIDGFGNIPVKFGRFLLKECKEHWDEGGLCWSFDGQIWNTKELFDEFLEKYLN